MKFKKVLVLHWLEISLEMSKKQESRVFKESFKKVLKREKSFKKV